MFIRPFNALAARSARRRQWFLNQLWTSIVGAETPANYRLRRLGQMESLEGRRVLATMYAATDSNQLLTFDSATPGTISNSVAITGLVAGERVVGIDTRPATGQLYAFGLVDDGATRTGRIYTLDPITGVASQVGNAPWSTTLNDTQFVGFNFNPNVDRIRIVDRQGANFRVHPDTGALAGTDTNLSVAGINGVAYTNNDGARSTTTLYGLNIDQDALVTIGGIDGVPSPNTGVVNTIGSTGLVALDSYGLEVTSIGGTTTAFASAERKLFSVNLVSGALTSLGTIGGGGVVIQAITAALDSITVAGSAGDDVVVVNATGSNSGSYSLNGGPSIPFANVASFSFIAGAGNDTLTINNPAGGLFAPSRGIDYQGGGQAGDSLNLLGGGSAAFTQTYSVGTRTPPVGNGGNNGDGLIRFAGPTPVDIRFTGLAPIIDTVLAASLTVTATDAANTISLTNGTAASRLQVAVDAFEPIEFTNKGALIVNAGDGVAGGDLGDTINVNYSNVPVGLTNMSINANEGDDVINVQAKAGAGIVVSISGNQGTNTFNFGLAGTLDAILGGSTFLFGNSGADKLNLNDAADGSNNIYTLTNNTFTRSGAGSIGYTNMSQVSLNAGTGSDTINTTSLFLSTQAFINAGGGDDTINATDSGSLSLIQGAMTYAGQAGNDRLNINDSSDGVTRIYTISNNVINRTSAGALNYDNTLETIDLAATNNGNSFLISSTAAGIVYNVNTGVGSDSIGTGNMSAIDGQVNLTTGGGFDQLAVSESSGLSDTFTLTQVGNATELTYGNGDAAIDLRYDATGPTGQLENFVLFTSGAAQTVIINNTTANNFTAVQTSDAADTITINGSGLTANNFITSNLGNDTLTLNVPGIITATALAINAGPANGTSSQRDQVNINDGQAGRSVSFDYANASNGDAVVGGLGTNINLNQVESLVYTGNGAFASVAGTSGTDELTVASLAGAAMFFLGGNPWDGPTDGAFSSALPGVAGPGAVKGPDILARGLNPFSSVNVSGDGGANDRLYLYASSEMDLLDPANPATPVFRGVGFGNGTLIPGRGVGNAYNNISVSDSAMFIQAGPTALTGVNFNGAQFVQANPLVPGVIVNAGDEAAPGPGGVADNISVSPSAQVLFQINGGDPTAAAAPQGDRLRVDFLGSVNAFNNKTPNVTITGSDARGVLSSSIERTLVTTGNGMVNLIGDNNNPAVDQADHFVVVGRDVDSAFGEGDTDGANELTASINGVELSFSRVQFLNVFGADLTGVDAGQIDTLEVTPYADNTPRGWGVATFFDENAPAGVDGDLADLLIVHTSAFGGAVSEEIIIQPSEVDAGEVIIKNRNLSTAIANISYVANTDIIVLDDDGFTTDTDTLTLRGTNADGIALLGDNTVVADFTRNGDAANPVVEVSDGGNLLYRLRTNALPGPAPLTFNAITIETLGGLDSIFVAGRNDGSLKINVDGGATAGVDTLQLLGAANGSDEFFYVPGATPDQVTVAATRATAVFATLVTTSNIDRFTFDGGGGTGSDSVTVFGTSAVDDFSISTASATQGIITVANYPSLAYQALGTTGSDFSLVNSPSLTAATSTRDRLTVTSNNVPGDFVWTPLTADVGLLGLTQVGITNTFSLEGFDSVLVEGTTNTDSLSAATAGAIITPGATSGSGRIVDGGLLPINYRSIENVTATGNTAVIQGTPGNDSITVSAAGIVTVSNTTGVVNIVNVSAFNSLVISGLDGDDRFTIAPSALFPQGISVVGGANGNGSDNLLVSGANLEINLETEQVSGVVGGPVSFAGIEHLNATATGDIAVVGRNAAEELTVTPTASSVAIIAPAAGGLLSIRTDNPGTLSIDGGGASDKVIVNGTSANDTINVSRALAATVQVGALKTITILTGNTEAVEVRAAEGNDTINLVGTGSLRQFTLDGGTNSGNDTVIVTNSTAGATTYTPGSTTDSGTLATPDGGVQLLGTELITLVGAAAADAITFNGTHNNDSIALQFLGGANRVWLNAQSVISFSSFGTVNLNGRFGDDKINVLPVGLVGVTTINVAGGDPTASDELVVSGTGGNNVIDYTVSNTVGAGTVTIAGTAAINFTTTEQLVIDGQGGTDSLSVTTPAGSGHRTTVTPGSSQDSGSIVSQAFGAGTTSVPVSYAHIGALGTVTLSGQGNIVEFNGTASSDTFSISGTTVQITNSTSGFVTNLYTLTNIFALEARGHAGDDVFNVVGTLAALTGGLVLDGGNPSASDVVNLSGAIGGLGVTLGDASTSSNTTITGYGAPVSLIGVETANLNAGSNSITVQGTSQPDALIYTPTAAAAGSLVNGGLNTQFNFTNILGALTVGGSGGVDSLLVRGSSSSDTITIVKGASTTVQVGANQTVTVPASSTESIVVDSGDGTDTFNVSGTSDSGQSLNLQGGSPTSNAGAAADVLNVTLSTSGTTAAVPGKTPDSGVITNPDGAISYDGIDFFNVVGAAGANTFNIQGTHANDTLALQFLGGANRVWVNERAVYTFANYATVNLNGLFGDDKINVLPVGLVGVTTINVAGGDPTASDELVVSGTGGNNVIDYTVSNTVGAGTVTIAGTAAINFTTTEQLVIDGQGGTDSLSVTTPAGSGHRTTVTPGSSQDSGSIVSQAFGAGTTSVPVSYAHIGALGTVTLSGQGNIVEFNGTASSDTFSISGTTVQITNSTSGFVTNLYTLTNIFALEARGHAGDDVFNVVGTLAALTGGLVLDGGNPSASDVVNLSGAIGGLGVTLGDASTSSNTTITGYGAPVSLIGVETANLNAGSNSITVQGTSQADAVVYTPTTATSGTFTKAGLNTLFNLSGGTNVTLDLLAGDDTLAVRATTQGDSITVNVPAGIVNTGGSGGIVNFVAGGIEALSVHGLQGADTFTVTPGAIPVFIDGGDPIGLLPGDQLIVNGSVGFFAGPENDEGGVQTIGAPVSFDHIESLVVAAIPGCPFLILGTNADDDITIIARDASTTVGADGVQDLTFSVNSGMNVVLLNVADLYIDAMAGDDDIVIRASAPNDAAWDVNVHVAGGSPSIGAPLDADRLVVETPNANGGFDNVVFNPTGFDTGNLVIDEDANGSYESAGTDSLITFGAFLFVCPPAAFTYTSTSGGVELVELNGEGTADDNLIINGTALDDTTVVNPTGAGTGTFASDASPQFVFKSWDALTVNPGTGGFDLAEIQGTSGSDAVTSNANRITLVGEVTLGAGLDQVNINTFDSADSVDLDLALPGLKKVIDVGTGNDTVNLLGLAVDPADPVVYGGEGDDLIIGSPNIDLIFGGRGNDTLIGAGGSDQLYGEDGNDIFGNPSAAANGVADDTGNDQFHGGAGSDTFVWEPGDGSDTLEGGAGEGDVLLFFGSAGAEVFNVFAKQADPSRAILFRNLGNITMDMAGVDQISVQGNAGADAYVIGRANNGDSGSALAPTSPYTDPTASLSDLSTTEVRVVNITEATDAPDNVFIDGRPADDNITVSVESPATAVLRVAGLPYDVRIIGSSIADRLTIRGNEGRDTIKTINPTGAGAQNVESIVGITLAGGAGDDLLSADAILIGGIGNDTLEGGAGDDQLVGNEGDDTMWGGGGNDSFDGGTGFDTILVRGSAGNDAIDISQTAATTLVHTVNGDVQTDTLVLSGTTRTVERAYVDSDAGSDTIRVQWADSLGIDGDVNSLRVDVDGGPGSTGDRLGVLDLGIGDLILYEKGTTDDSGSMTVGPGNAEALVVNFVNVEVAQPNVGNGGDVVVFKHDPFEFNNARTLATHLGASEAINVDPTINPGVDPIFGLPADEDWYRVVAEKTGVLDFQVYFRQVGPVVSGRPGLPNAGNLDISVTDVAGNVIVGFGTNDSTDNERVRIPVVAGQTYYLRVFGANGGLNNYNITIDNYAPPTPTDIELLDNPVTHDPPLASNSDTGRSQVDNITRDSTPTLVFRLDDAIFLNDLPGNNLPGSPPDEVIPIAFQAAAGVAGYRIAIFDEGSSPLPGNQVGTPPQTPLGFATFVSAGVYQFTTPLLSDGSHFLTARVQMVDPATAQQTGFGPRAIALEVIVDTAPPPVFFGNLVSATDGLLRDSDSGIATVLGSFVDRITNDVTPTMFGSAEADSIMRLYVDRTNNGFTADDLFLGQTVARPLDGTNQHLGEWDITPTAGLNSPELVAALGKDGLRRLFVTAEDVAGNISVPATLDIMIDTTPPFVTSVTLPSGDSVFQLKPMPIPTPPVNSIFVTFTGGPVSAGGFNLLAVDPGLATDTGNYQLIGDHNGNILVTNAAIVSQDDTTVIVRLDFAAPLPDDRFTLTLKDSISDAANNSLDGDSQAQSPGTDIAILPSGNGINGGDFVARFTVDSRPEIGAISEGLVYVDINGNFLWDPTGKDNDKTNRDFVFQFGQLVDAHFAGNFAPAGAAVASGFDKLGAYGRFAGVYSFILDTNDDGVGDFTSLMPPAYQVNGNPIAGDFNAAHAGDEIGLFDGQFWYLDVNGNNQIGVGERIATNFNGLPLVGDFNGDGADDLATFNNANNTFYFDTNRDGNFDFTWNVADDVGRFVGLSGFTDRPVAGDLNLDGIDDIGLWVKDRQGTLPRESGEYFFWLSDQFAANPANVFDAYSPDPLGNDLFAEFGDELALPIFGNFDPPIDNASQDENVLHRQADPLDINGDGFVTAIDALLAINVLNTFPNLPGNNPVRAYFTIGEIKADTNGDRTVSAIDALLVINELNRRVGGGEGEADLALLAASSSPQLAATDDYFAQLGDWDLDLKRRRGL